MAYFSNMRPHYNDIEQQKQENAVGLKRAIDLCKLRHFDWILVFKLISKSI